MSQIIMKTESREKTEDTSNSCNYIAIFKSASKTVTQQNNPLSQQTHKKSNDIRGIQNNPHLTFEGEEQQISAIFVLIVLILCACGEKKMT